MSMLHSLFHVLRTGALTLAGLGALLPAMEYTRVTRGDVALPRAGADESSNAPRLSADGRYVLFGSEASNLVPGDTNSNPDLFRRDTQTGETVRVNVETDGSQAIGYTSWLAAISGNGRYVAFATAASLVSADTNALYDVYLRDVQASTTILVSERHNLGKTLAHAYAGSISDDGRLVVFESEDGNYVDGDTNGKSDIFLRDVQASTTTRVSVSTSGDQGSDHSSRPVISADGSKIVFESLAINLLGTNGDTNAKSDIFLRTLGATPTTVRISVSSSGTQVNDGSFTPDITADGRYVIFSSTATNLVTGDTNGRNDIFRRDLNSSVTMRLSLSSTGAQLTEDALSPAITTDGKYAVYVSGGRVIRRDVIVETLAYMDPGWLAGDNSSLPAISRDGRRVAFLSTASGLVVGDINSKVDVFSRDTQVNTTQLISVPCDPRQMNGASDNPVISSDGRYVAYTSFASNLVAVPESRGLYWQDLVTGTLLRLDRDGATELGGTAPEISGNGQRVAFIGYTYSNLALAYLWEASSGAYTTLSAPAAAGVLPNGTTTQVAISRDGAVTAFASVASNLVANDSNAVADIFVRELLSGLITRVSLGAAGAQANGASKDPALSADGRYVVFTSAATNLVANDTNGKEDVFRFDRQTQVMELVSVNLNGQPGNGDSHEPRLSGDGSFVVFASTARDLIAGASGWSSTRDRIFRRQMGSMGQTLLVSKSASGTSVNDNSANRPMVTDDGRFVVFETTSKNLAPDDEPAGSVGFYHIFRRDVESNVTVRLDPYSLGTNYSGHSRAPCISPDGAVVVFASELRLVPSDWDKQRDIYVARFQARSPQTITFAAPADQIYGSTLTLSASANSGLPVTLSVSGPATLAGAMVTTTGTGVVTVTASQGGNGTYAAADFVLRSFTVSAKMLTVGGLTATDRAYDGTTAVVVTGTPVLEGALSGDDVQIAGTAVGSFADAASGVAKAVSVTGLTLAGTTAGKYQLELPTLRATIIGRSVTVSGLTAGSKIYDGTTTAVISGTPVLSGVAVGDVVVLIGTAVGNFAQPGAGIDLTVTMTGLSLGGAQGAAYSLVVPTVTATITRAAATVDLTDLAVVHDGAPHGPTVTTTPAGLAVALTFAGASTMPQQVGRYLVVATVTNANYSGGAEATFEITAAPAGVNPPPAGDGGGGCGLGGGIAAMALILVLAVQLRLQRR